MLKFIPQTARFVALGALASGLTLAHADTIGSFVGASAAGLVNTTFVNSATGAVAGYDLLGVYTAPFTGTAYISYDSNGGNGGYNITTYTTTFSGNYSASGGTIDYLVDNDLGITINGHNILPDAETTTFPAFEGSGVTIAIPVGDLIDGTNILTFDVFNSGGPSAFDFTGTVTPAASATPEPGSLVLLGTGMLGLAGAVRRRLTK